MHMSETSTSPSRPDFDAVRADFPRAATAVYLDNASCHPLSIHVAAALHRYVDWATCEVSDPWWPAWAQTRDESKRLFAQMINARLQEISFARSAVEAERNLLNGPAAARHPDTRMIRLMHLRNKLHAAITDPARKRFSNHLY